VKTNRKKDLNCSVRTTGFRFTARMSSWLDQSAAAVALGIFFHIERDSTGAEQAPRSPTPTPPVPGACAPWIVQAGLPNS
jgi:hypothetical protein